MILLFTYMKLRTNRFQLYLAFAILSLIAVLHISEVQNRYAMFQNLESTPYTKWLLFDTFSGLSIVYLLLMPLAIAIGVSDIFIHDKHNNLLMNAYIYKSKVQTDFYVILYSSIVAFIVSALPLILNVVGIFLVLPDIKPDRYINHPIGMNMYDTLSVNMHYDHPYLYILTYIVLAGVWGSIMNILAISMSLYTNKRIIAIIGPFVFQIFLIIVGNLTQNEFVVPPVYFIQGITMFMQTNYLVIVLTFLIYAILSIYFYISGNRKNEIN